MDEIRQPGKWLDAKMSEQETADFMKITAIMSELDGEQDQEKILNSTAPYMNSFMHLMYLIIRGKLGLEATDDGVKYKDQENLYFDLVKYVIDFVLFRRTTNDLVTPEQVSKVLPQLSSIIPQQHIISNHKFANSLTSKEKWEAGKFNLDVGRKKGDIKILCILSYEGDNVQLTGKQPFTEYDRQVADAVTSLYKYGDKSHIVTAATVYRAMVHATETETPSQQQIDAVMRSLDKMRFMRVQIDCSEELTKRKLSLNGAQITGGNIDTYLLNMERVEVEAGGQKVVAYKVVKTPILYEYSHLIGQVITVPAELLDIRDENGAKVSNTERRIAIKGYLMRRISVMKGKTATSRHILFDSIYDEVHNSKDNKPTDKEKRAMREYIPQVLDYWKRQRFIKGYSYIKQGKKRTGISISI